MLKNDLFNSLHTAWPGLLYMYDGQYEEAERMALESFENEKDYSVGYNVPGRIYLDTGRANEAVVAHKKLAELYPW